MPQHKRIVDKAGTQRRLEARLRKYKLATEVLAIAVVLLAVYAVYPSVSAYVRGPIAGNVLTGINMPLSASQLSAINNAPNSYFEIAGQAMLNLSIPGEAQQNGSYVGVVYVQRQLQHSPLVIGGKPTVIYVGAISCIFCGENRWAMALALSRFGNFSSLYNGYSSEGDGDVPTLYWAPQNITTTGSVNFNNFYSSRYINLITAEYDSPIVKGFEIPSNGYTYFIQHAQNQSQSTAMSYISQLGQFQGTPTTFWGGTLDGGADAVVFGTSNSLQVTNYPALTYMTHSQIIGQLKGFNTTLAVEEYAAADVYVAQTCIALNNTAPVCALPAIGYIEKIIA